MPSFTMRSEHAAPSCAIRTSTSFACPCLAAFVAASRMMLTNASATAGRAGSSPVTRTLMPTSENARTIDASCAARSGDSGSARSSRMLPASFVTSSSASGVGFSASKNRWRMDSRCPMVSCTRAFMRTIASSRDISATRAIDSRSSTFSASKSSFARSICALSDSSSVTSIATMRRHSVLRRRTTSRLNRHIRPEGVGRRIPSGRTAPPSRRARASRSAQRLAVSDRSVANPSLVRRARIASFMYRMRRLPSAQMMPSGRRSSASTTESVLTDVAKCRTSSTSAATVRNRKNAASAMNRYTHRSPSASMTGGVHSASSATSNAMAGLRFATASTRPTAAAAKSIHKNGSSGRSKGRRRT